jgi:hypothetical protein
MVSLSFFPRMMSDDVSGGGRSAVSAGVRTSVMKITSYENAFAI